MKTETKSKFRIEKYNTNLCQWEAFLAGSFDNLDAAKEYVRKYPVSPTVYAHIRIVEIRVKGASFWLVRYHPI